ncbi:hypothetical protein PPYR_05815 [Photinus pyralis]|uniref:Uncharacterized protein n=2 Tax=Photinus pyralis TaxID=7054 RepID=A0A5N4AVU9_PHOPY|nr:uncharacterized protein LOC116165378 [Photinus pyralis]KAB0801461.1 hypothetical protein PPYR_05815 [Photinus pyralis]
MVVEFDENMFNARYFEVVEGRKHLNNLLDRVDFYVCVQYIFSFLGTIFSFIFACLVVYHEPEHFIYVIMVVLNEYWMLRTISSLPYEVGFLKILLSVTAYKLFTMYVGIWFVLLRVEDETQALLDSFMCFMTNCNVKRLNLYQLMTICCHGIGNAAMINIFCMHKISAYLRRVEMAWIQLNFLEEEWLVK